MRIFGIVLCLIVLGLTGYSAITYKAPEIEADLRERTSRALAALTDDGIDVRVDGRHVTLAGHVAGDEQRQEALDAAASVPGVLGPIDALEGIATASPYGFGAVKDAEGRVAIEGVAPSVELKAAIEADARAIFGDQASVEIEIAAGAPPGDWRAAAGAAMDALATMKKGKLAITDLDIALEGEVADEAGVEAIDLFAAMMPQGFNWTHDVGVDRMTAAPFTFSVVKGADGGLYLSGFAPDEQVRASFVEEGEAVSGGKPVVADLEIADGMPDEGWPALVQAGISAMRDMETGRFDVVDNDVSFSSDPAQVTAGEPEDEQVTATKSPASNEGAVDAALTPAPAEPEPSTPALVVDKVENGVWSVRGTVPDRQSEEKLVSLVRDRAGADDVEVELALAGDAGDGVWLGFAADHIRTLDEVIAGRLSVEDFETHLIGVVETPDDLEPAQAALSAIDPAMTVDLQPIDPRPAASLDLQLTSDEGVKLTGALPGGLNEGEALLALGIQRYDGRLSENGRGRAEIWRRHLTEIGALLPAFEQIDLSLGGERPSIKGKVHAPGNADGIARELVLALSDERQPLVDVETTTTLYKDDARRTNPLNGREEFHRQGYWLPVIEIDAGEESCAARSSSLLEADKITFLRGEAKLDSRTETVLNALAALAIACFEGTGLALEIGGHTDSRGAADMNQKLSQDRADAVLDALIARGVDGDRLAAVGYGPSQPIADNGSDEGRAANRRITFAWTPSADLRVTDTEG